MSTPLVHLSQEQFEEFVSHSAEVIYQADAAGRITYVNPRMEELLGYSSNTLVGAHYLTIVHPDARSETHRFYAEQSRADRRSSYHEFPAVAQNGRRIWLAQHVQLLRRDGAVRGFHAAARDISDQRRAASDLLFRDARAKVLTELADCSVPASDRLKQALERAAELVGVSTAAISRLDGGRYRVVYHAPAEGGVFEGQLLTLGDGSGHGVVATGKASESELAEDLGLLGWHAFLGVPVDIGGVKVGLLSFSDPAPRPGGFSDADIEFARLLARWAGSVLEQSFANERVSTAERQLNAVVSALTDGVLICSPDGRILSANGAAREMLRLDREPLGKDVRLFLPEFMKAGDGDSRDSEAMLPDGTTFGIELTVTPVGQSGRRTLLGVFRDATERARHATQLQRREAALRAFFDGTPLLMGILSLREGHLVHLSANAAAIEFFGLLRPSAGGTTAVELPLASEWEKACGRCLAERRPVRFEARIRERWLNVTINLIDDGTDGAPRFSYVVEDVSVNKSQAHELAKRRAEFEAIYRSIPYAAVFAGTDGRIVAVNPAFSSIFGFGPDEAVGREARALYPDGPPDAAARTNETRFLRSDGTAFEAETIQVPVRGDDGEPLGSLTLVEDLTERNANRDRMRMQSDILSQVRDAVVVLDHELRVTYWNAGAEAISGYAPREAEGRPVLRLTPFRWETSDEEQYAVHALINSGTWKGRLRLRARGGTSVFVDAVVSLMRDGEGEASGMLVVARDVSDTVKLERQLRHQARTDALTGLPNRTTLDDRVQEAIVRRDEQAESFALIFVDLDRFKLINDSLGHAIGDGLLQQVAARIGSTLRPRDVVARIGGDEFAVLVADAKNEHETRKLARRVAAAFDEPFRVGGRDLPCSASLGIVMGDVRYREPAGLLRDADTAMYEAKRRGPGTFVVFSEAMHEDVKKRFRLESDLAFAITGGELELYYQPIVALETGALAGFEALVRWNHPDLGRMSPDEFLPMAHERGLLASIDRWVVRQAAAQLSCWLQMRPGLTMRVNSSTDTVLTADYRETVRRAVHEFGLPAGALEIEITEHVLLEDPAGAAGRLEALKAAGVRLSVDDFGTGYSSLSLLHALPLDSVKTDRSLLGAELSDRRENHILKTIGKLCEALELERVAEGIETEGQLAEVRALGYEYGQGYLFSEPRPAPGAERLLRTPGWVGYWATSGPERPERNGPRGPVRRARRAGQRSTVSPNSGTDTRS